MQQNTPSASDLLRTPAIYLKGVGEARAELLKKLDLFRAFDFLFYFPRDYQDMTDFRDVSQLEPKKLQTIGGTIRDCEVRETRKGIITILNVRSGNDYVQGIWFNMPNFQRRDMIPGRRILMTGKPAWNPPFWKMTHPVVTYLADDEYNNESGDPFLPVYPLTEGITQFHLRRIIRDLLPSHAPLLDEVFPPYLLERFRLVPISEAVKAIHFPNTEEEKNAARRRFVFQELFILQLGLAMRRIQHQTQLKATAIESNPKIDTRIRQIFPFQLTEAQNKVVREIIADMARPFPMNRLLQGDVGSGKTLVALYAMLVAVANNFQCVFMSPTEVLARQHLRTLQRILENSDVKIAEMFGGQKPTQRGMFLQQIMTGEAKIVVGTQAILSNAVSLNYSPFHKLGLVVIDEQHKFGVKQRGALKSGTKFDPHYLVMTATPIPRSVTMTLFGDLDVSLLDSLPPGRQKVKSYYAEPNQREKWDDFVRNKLREGRQAFVVVPLVEESENWDASSLVQTFDRLKNGPYKDFRVGYIHGRMTTEEKERIMLDFRSGEIQVLVATTVIEVGVDVPNATLLTIESAERFGIAQLHQLRGRIGRGAHPGFCSVFANPTNDETKERLKAFVNTSDGFALAEKDFELRGAGDLFGTQQHGLPPLRIADLTRDRAVLYEAREAALNLVHSDPGLALPEHGKLRKQMLARYGAVLELGDVG